MNNSLNPQIFHLPRIIRVCFFALLCVLFSNSYSQISDSNDEYRVHADDLLSINVFGQKDLSFDRIRVNSIGHISLPLIGELNVAGLRTVEIAAKIEMLYVTKDYLLNPQVTVFVKEYPAIFIYGEVNKPGAYPFENNLTIEKAIALAGGLAPRASEDKIMLRRKGRDNVERNNLVQMQKRIQPGDVITIGESFF